MPETGYFGLQKEDFITESVLRLIQGSDAPDGGRHESSGIGCSASADERGSGENRLSSGACNPLVWQASIAGLVDKKVLGNRRPVTIVPVSHILSIMTDFLNSTSDRCFPTCF